MSSGLLKNRYQRLIKYNLVISFWPAENARCQEFRYERIISMCYALWTTAKCGRHPFPKYVYDQVYTAHAVCREFYEAEMVSLVWKEMWVDE